MDYEEDIYEIFDEEIPKKPGPKGRVSVGPRAVFESAKALAEHLKVSEKTILRLIEDGGSIAGERVEWMD